MIVASAVALQFVTGLLVAYGLYRLTFGVKALNTLMFMPSIITPVVAALFLRWIFHRSVGPAEWLADQLGMSPDFLGDPNRARVIVILADAWQFTPFMEPRRMRG